MSTAITREDGFSVTTRFQATSADLYKAWTEKASLEGWLATIAEVDTRVDGEYIYRWPTPDGELSARGKYIELVPGKRIVQSWESWGPAGRYEDGDAILKVEFVDAGDGTTEMTQTETSDSYSEPDRIDMSINGTIEAHGTLATFIESSLDKRTSS